MNLLGFLVSITGLAVLTSVCSACDDIDTAACLRMSAIKHNMCNDTCYASVCKRHCGMCPLQCYSCREVDHPQTCKNVIECPTHDHKCVSLKSYTDDFREVYKLGCAPPSVCAHGKRSITKRAGPVCCGSDKCNHHDLSKRDTPRTVAQNNRRFENKRAKPVCGDIDNLACTLLFTSDTTICKDHCIANEICPRLCGKCTECYECDHVLRTEKCNSTRVCDAGEVCYTLESLNFDLQQGFRLGCLNQTVCDRLSEPPNSIFGRRSDSVEVSLSGGCCYGDLCNHHKLHKTRAL